MASDRSGAASKMSVSVSESHSWVGRQAETKLRTVSVPSGTVAATCTLKVSTTGTPTLTSMVWRY